MRATHDHLQLLKLESMDGKLVNLENTSFVSISSIEIFSGDIDLENVVGFFFPLSSACIDLHHGKGHLKYHSCISSHT